MSVTALLRAKHVGIRDLKSRLSELIEEGRPLVATRHGAPRAFLVPYDDMTDLLDMVDELSDKGSLARVARARSAYAKGGWVPFSGGRPLTRQRRTYTSR